MVLIQDQFTTTQLGNLFMMRLLAFIQDNNAKLLDIDEHSARLEVGGRSFSDWLMGRAYIERTQIELAFAEAPSRSQADPTTRLDVSVTVKPGRFARRAEFPAIASHFVREMRGYFAGV